MTVDGSDQAFTRTQERMPTAVKSPESDTDRLSSW
jgi:hypothetical protein